jgi:hypothetical protein
LNHRDDQFLREQYAEYLENITKEDTIKEKKSSQSSLGVINVSGAHALIGNSFGNELELRYKTASYNNRKKAKTVANVEKQKNIQTKFGQSFKEKQVITNLSETRQSANVSFNPSISIGGNINTLGGSTIIGSSFGDNIDLSYNKQITYFGEKEPNEEMVHKINLEGIDIAPLIPISLLGVIKEKNKLTEKHYLEKDEEIVYPNREKIHGEKNPF